MLRFDIVADDSAGDDSDICPTSLVRSKAPEPVARVDVVPLVTPVAVRDTATLLAALVWTTAVWSLAVTAGTAAAAVVGVPPEAVVPPEQAVATRASAPMPMAADQAGAFPRAPPRIPRDPPAMPAPLAHVPVVTVVQHDAIGTPRPAGVGQISHPVGLR